MIKVVVKVRGSVVILLAVILSLNLLMNEFVEASVGLCWCFALCVSQDGRVVTLSVESTIPVVVVFV